jgi:phage/plasmid-associated DNA primase
MENTPHPTLEISKTPCFLDNAILAELFPFSRVTNLLNSQKLGDVWDETNYAHKYSATHHANQVQQLRAYLGNYNPQSKSFKVKYSRGRDGYGRAFVNKALGLTAFSKKVRNTFIKDLYYDFDLSNAQPAIIKNICEKNNIPCDAINKYISDREEILGSISTAYNVSRTKAKKLMLRLCFFGSVEEWKSENGIKATEDIPFLSQFRNQLNFIAMQVKERNPSLYETCRQKKEAKKQKNFLGSFFSTYLQEYETQIVSKVLRWIVCETNITKVENCEIPVATYEFDGLKLLKDKVDSFGKEQFLQQLKEKTLTLTGFDLNWEEKPIDQGFDIFYTDDECPAEVQEMFGVFNDLEASEKLFKLYPHWKYCNQQLYVFNENTGMWSPDKVVHDEIVIKHTKYLYVATLDKDGNTIISKTKSYGNTENLRNKIYSSLKTLCHDDNWLKEKQYSSLGKLLFKNGYFDAKEGRFYTDRFNPDIVFFAGIPHEFEHFSDEDMEYMNDIKTRLFHNPLGEKQGDFLILNLARGLMGDMMKRFLMGLGGTNCGKSILTTAVSLACGQYVGSFNAENLAYRNSNEDEAKAMRWALLLRYKRLIFSNEMKTKTILNGNMIKKLSSGGDTLTGRTHCKEEEEFIPHFLPVCFANDLPKIAPYDDAVDTRLRFVSFKKEFVDEPTNEFQLQKDENIENEIKTLRFQRVLVGLFIQTYLDFKENGTPDEPVEVIMAKEEWAGDEKDPLNKVLSEFEVTNNTEDYVESADIQEYLEVNKIDMSMKKFGTLLMKYCAINKCDKVKSDNKKVKGKVKKVWFGIKRIFETDEEM